MFLRSVCFDDDRGEIIQRWSSGNTKRVSKNYTDLVDFAQHFMNFFRFWGIKFMLVIGGIIGAFFIPEGTFGITWMWFGIIGGLLFILIQLLLIVDFAHSVAESWVGNYDETESNYYALIGVTLVCYLLSITGIVLLFVFFTTVSIFIKVWFLRMLNVFFPVRSIFMRFK